MKLGSKDSTHSTSGPVYSNAASSRRFFLHKLACLPLIGTMGCTSRHSDSETSQSANTPSFPAHFKGSKSFRGSPKHLEESQVYNPRIQLNPQVIAHVSSTEDVVTLVKFAKEQKRNLRIRCGGHSYEGYSMGEDIVLDLKNLNQIIFHPERNTVTVGAGCRQGDIYNALIPLGQTMVMGTCKSVGIGGFSLGGGYSMLSRQHGMAVDNLISANIVDAQGRPLHLSESSNRDLFWAIRGAGTGQFGVVTQLEFKTHPAKPQCVFKYTWNLSAATQVVPIWFEFVKQSPDHLTWLMTLTSFNVMTVSGQMEGTDANFRSLIQKLGNWPIKPTKEEINAFTYKQAVDFFAGKDTSARPARFRAHAGYWEKPPSLDALTTLLALVEKAKQFDSMFCMFDSYGGAINRVGRQDTAFVHRSPMLSSMQTRVDWKDPAKDDDSIQYIKEFNETMAPFLSKESYQNYMDATRLHWEESFYAENLPKLRTIKKQFDPDSFFKFERSIS